MRGVDETVRREKALDFSRCNSRPGSGSLHPDGSRSRLFLRNEKHSFLGDFPAGQPGSTSSFAGGEGNRPLSSTTKRPMRLWTGRR
jgi:hypothetical protein